MLTFLDNPTPADRKILTVSDLNRATNLLIGNHFQAVLVVGEISNLSMPSSGHIYFSLKDAHAQVRCAWFRSSMRRMSNPARLENGKQIVVCAQAGLYEPRGDFQLIVESVEEAGLGDLQKAFEQLKIKLAAEGLFAAEHKQALPLIPRAIGVITSPTGAAVKDILSVLKRRFPYIPVIIYPTSVQGLKAVQEIAEAIAGANRHNVCDVLILARGGGSLEDLWAFNEERVARAIFASRLPIISGIGHETDTTIADFVADMRAPTPTAAAEHATPDWRQWLEAFRQIEGRLIRLWQRSFNERRQRLDWLAGRLSQQHPGQQLTRNRQQINDYQRRLYYCLQNKLYQKNQIVNANRARLEHVKPILKLTNLRQYQTNLSNRLYEQMQHKMTHLNLRLVNASQTLQAISPLATLNRGYALARLLPAGAVIRSTKQIKPGDQVRIHLADGGFTGQVLAVNDNESIK